MPPFYQLAVAPHEHFKLVFYAVVMRICVRAAALAGSPEEALRQFPFLAGYVHELQEMTPPGMPLDEALTWWAEAVAAWCSASPVHLPFRALEEAGLSSRALETLVCIGMIDEEPRF